MFKIIKVLHRWYLHGSSEQLHVSSDYPPALYNSNYFDKQYLKCLKQSFHGRQSTMPINPIIEKIYKVRVSLQNKEPESVVIIWKSKMSLKRTH